MKKDYVVIGLGRFGSSVVKTLIDNNHEVLAIDRDMSKVEKVLNIATQAVQADCTDEEVIQDLGLRNYRDIIVAIGEDIHSSILISLLLKEIGVKTVIAKAKDENHGKMLSKIGVDRVVHPERDMGVRLAKQLSTGNLVDYINLSDDYDIVEITAPSYTHGKSIKELSLKAKKGYTIVAVKRDDDVIISPLPNATIESGDELLIIGDKEEIKRLDDSYGG